MDRDRETDERLAQIPDAVGLLRGIFAHAPVGFQIYTPDGQSILTNPAFREMFQSEPPPEYNILVDEIARKSGVLDRVHRAFAGETVHVPAIWYDPRELTQVKVENARRVAMESTFFPLFDAAGKVAYVAIVFKDVTAEVEAEEKARFLAEAGAVLVGSLDYEASSQEVARLAIAGFADFCAIDIIDGGRWRRVATAHSDPSKRPILEELQQRYPPRLDSPQPAARVIRSRQPELLVDVDDAIRQAHTVDDGHLSLIRQLDFRSHLAVPMEARGRVVGALSFGRGARQARYDSEDVRLAMELGRRVASAFDTAQLYRDAQEAIRARDEFLSIASHELKTPLTPLGLQLDMLANLLGNEQEERITARLSQAKRQAVRLNGLVDHLLDISRITVGKLTLELEEVDLSRLASEVIERMRDEARRANCILTAHIEPDLVGRFDRLRIDQVVTNLLSNALKYGAGHPVEISLARDHQSITLRVSDHGIGIAATDQERIFERFERAASSRHYGGLGLGLYITRQIVEAHGGSIALASQPGQGATFVVTLSMTPKG